MKVLVVGCSGSYGLLFEHGPLDERLWFKRLIKQTIGEAEITNLSESARNNEWIFLQTALEITKNKYDLVLVQWTELERLNVHLGLETYDTMHLLQKNGPNMGIVNHVTVPGRWLAKLGDNLRTISNPHWAILNLVKYTNTLINIQEKIHKSKIAFVSGALGIPDDYFQKKNIKLPSDLSKFEQDILSVPLRNDKEIFELYNKIHEDYQNAGGMPLEYWLNPLSQHTIRDRIDSIVEGDYHPGHHSHAQIADICAPKLKILLSKTLG